MQQPPSSTSLPPKKRLAQASTEGQEPVDPSAPAVEEQKKQQQQQPLLGLKQEEKIAIEKKEPAISDTSPSSPAEPAVETSKIRGLAPPRKPRIGEEYQAKVPELSDHALG